MRPRLLDLFAGAGGAACGYHRAGFDVTGVDIAPQKHYPFEFHQADALHYAAEHWHEYDAIHASPPCQAYSITANLARAQGKKPSTVNLIPATRGLLRATGLPYVIENVPGAPLLDPVTLCGSSFGLAVRRHRLFESNVLIPGLACDHASQGRPVGVYGSKGDDIPRGGRTARTLAEGQAAMGIDWMPWSRLIESIPPAYAQFIGEQLLAWLQSDDGQRRDSSRAHTHDTGACPGRKTGSHPNTDDPWGSGSSCCSSRSGSGVSGLCSPETCRGPNAQD